jgi:hypothetical protein
MLAPAVRVQLGADDRDLKRVMFIGQYRAYARKFDRPGAESD